MSFNQVAADMSAEVYQQFKTAIEIGRWPDGKKLSAQQKQLCLEAILRYEQEHVPPEKRTGYIPPKHQTDCSPAENQADQEQALRWKS